ncbi:MAG: ABC transporter permease [Mobilitalea sp.]
MKFSTFITKMIQINIRKYSLFLLSAIFSMSTFFVFVNLWFTDSFQGNTNSQMHSLMVIAAVITVVFSAFIISYVHWYLMRERIKSFAVLLSYGMQLKDLRKLIINETLMIYLVSLSFAYLTGSIFSKLFFMISIKLLSIEGTNIVYQLTLESFQVTAVVFFIIFIFVLMIALVRISKKDLIELSKAVNNVELNNKGSVFMGCVGIVLLIGSMIVMYLHNRNTVLNVSPWILGSGFFCLIGTYLVISHFSRLIYASFKKDSKKYYNHILEASEFAMSYRQNRKTLFVLTLLTIGIVIFTSVTYTLYKESNNIIASENPHDLYFQEFEAFDILGEYEISSIFSQSDTIIKESKELSFIYMMAPDLQLNSWRAWKWVPIVSESVYNSCFGSDYQVKSGEVLQIIFESGIDRDTNFFEEEIRLKNAITQYTLQTGEPVYDKILNRYVFTQSVLLIADDNDFIHYETEASSIEKGKLYLYKFENWKKSQGLYHNLSTSFYEAYDKAANEKMSINKELIERYGYAHLQIRSKIEFFHIQKMQGEFSLFIMGFVSILFAFCTLVTYSFKVYMNASEDRVRLKKLDGIGMLHQEKEKLIKIRIQLLMFVPTILGILIGALWFYSINFSKIIEIDLPGWIILRNALCTGVIYLAIIIVAYFILSNAYLQRLKQN